MKMMLRGGAFKPEQTPQTSPGSPTSIQTCQAPGRGESFGRPLIDLLYVNLSNSVLKSRFAFPVRNTDFSEHFTALSSCLLARGIGVLHTRRREEKTLESINSSRSCCGLLIDQKLPLSNMNKLRGVAFLLWRFCKSDFVH